MNDQQSFQNGDEWMPIPKAGVSPADLDINELSGLVIGEAIYIHQQLGPGLLEQVYETCLEWRLKQNGLKVERQKPIPLSFEGVQMENVFRCDLLVESRLLLELKAIDTLHDIHLAQLLTYLKITGVKLGLLMNFNVTKMKDGIKRVVNNL